MKLFRIEFLFLIWIIPLLMLVYWYGMKRRKGILLNFSTPQCLNIIAPQETARLRTAKACMLLLAILWLILAMTGPKYGYSWQEIERKGIDIIIALDCSKSMLARDIKPTRLDRAKREVYDLLTMLKGDRVGLVAFAGTAFLQCPLTLDYDAYNLFLNALTPDFLPVGGTNLSAAIHAAISGFDPKSKSEKAIILITDGENTEAGDPLKAAEDARKAGIKLFSIGVGSQDGVPIPSKAGGFKKDGAGKIILSRLDESTLKKMAVSTLGTYVRSVAGDMDLDVIYAKEIRGKMEASTLSGGRKKIWEDRYQWVLGLAIALVLMEMFVPSVGRKWSGMLSILLVITFLPAAAQAGPAQDGLEAYKKGQYDQALKLFIEAQLENPEKPELLYNLGNAYYKTGDFESAYQHYLQALKSEDHSLRQKIQYNLGNTSFRKRQMEQAVKHYESALKLDPKDSQARQNLAFVKKIMQQQQKSPSNQQGDRDKDRKDRREQTQSPESGQPGSENKEQKNQQQSQSGQQSHAGQNKDPAPAPQYGQEMDAADNQTRSTQKPGGEKDAEKAAAAAKSPETQGPNREPQPAAKMLNRLDDRPGRAMMPIYRKQTVEKDW
jgi:Ca-activated chloride channel family protein